MKKHNRVTVYIQDDENILIRQARLVDEADLESIDRVFKLFNLHYEVDEIPAATRLYSLSVALRDRHISDSLLTRQELAEHISPYLGRGKIISQDEFKKLLSGKSSQIYKETSNGEILIGYELTTRGEAPKSIFRLPRIKFRKKAEGSAA